MPCAFLWGYKNSILQNIHEWEYCRTAVLSNIIAKRKAKELDKIERGISSTFS